MTPAEQIAALEAEAVTLEAEAEAAALTPDEVRLAAALARAQAAREVKGVALATRRANDAASRLAAARAKHGPGVLLAAVDLVALFPLSSPPPPASLPNGGVIIIHNPAPELESNLLVELEHKGQGGKLVDRLLIDLLCKSVADPDVAAPDAGGAEGMKLRAFCESYPAAAMQAAGEARRLGGAKVREAKRGRE